MATYSFYYPGAPPPNPVGSSSGPYVLANEVTPSASGLQITAVCYYKWAGDTVSGRTATIYNPTTQAVYATATFGSETASGWQVATLSTPLNVTSGTTYRIAVQAGVTNGYYQPWSNPTIASIAAMGSLAYYATGGTAFPNLSGGSAWYDVDVILATIPTTGLRASQVLDEAFVTVTSKLSASQVLAEGWIQNQPPTGLNASQVVAEGWATMVPVALSASQILAEAWVQNQPPTGLRASQMVAEGWASMTSIRLQASQIVAEVWVSLPPPGPPVQLAVQVLP